MSTGNQVMKYYGYVEIVKRQFELCFIFCSELTNKTGSKCLENILNEQLKEHIKQKLPGLYSDMKRELERITNELGFMKEENPMENARELFDK